MIADREIKVRCSACGHLTRIPTITNADRIRAMTDEELAKKIGDIIDCAICKSEVFKTDVCPGSIMIGEKGCYDMWFEWLKQECEA